MRTLLCMLLLSTTNFIYAKEISGVVSDTENKPLHGVTVTLTESGLNTMTDQSGSYKIEIPSEGIVTIQFSFIGYATVVKHIDANAGTLNINLEKSGTELNEVIITSNNTNTKNNTPYAVDIYTKDELDKTNGITLMSRLATRPGIDRISAGIGIGKPVIRGNSFNRILIYAMGTRIENQQWDDRHDLGIAESGVEKVEVVQGPAALIYGADALGGALIFSDERPAATGTSKGDATIGYHSTDGAITGDIGYKKTINKGLYYILRVGGHLVHSYKQGGEAPPNSQVGKFAANSKYIDASGKAAVGINKKWGSTKLSYSFYQQLIGIVELEPDSIMESEHEQKAYEVEAPYQDVMTHILSSETMLPLRRSHFNINLSYQLNDRKEFEPLPGGPKKSRFELIGLKLNVFTYDVKWTSDPSKNFGITVGTQGMGQQNVNGGKEKLVPDAIVTDFAGYILARYDKNQWNILGGIRSDLRSIEIENRAVEGDGELIFPADDISNDYTPITGSLGIAFHPVTALTLKLNVASGFSAPNYAELGTYGKHEGVNRFEIGNPNFEMEENIEGDFGIEWDSKNFTLYGEGFYNSISNYIFIEANGDTISGLPVYRFLQDDATISGFSAGVGIHPVTVPWLAISADYSAIRGERENSDLPFIPADKLISDLTLSFAKKIILKEPYFRFTVSHYFEQDKVSEFELTTADYTLLDFSIGGKFKMRKNDATLSLFVTNITDEAYYNHLSIVKNIGIREMGRSMGFRINMPFGS